MERRRRDVHRGRATGRADRSRLARGSRGRRRERRRAPGPVRRGVHGPERHRPVGLGLPDEPPRRARSPLPQRGQRRERTHALSRGREAGRHRERRRSRTASERCSRTTTATAASTCTWPTTPTRTSCTGTLPRSGALGFRLEEVAKREAVDDPNAGMGIAAADYSLDGRTDLFVTNSRAAAARRVSESAGRRTRALVRRRPAGARRRPRHALDGLGHVVGRPRPRRRPRSRGRQRRDPRREPRPGRAEGARAGERRRARRAPPASWQQTSARGSRRTPRVNGRGLATARLRQRRRRRRRRQRDRRTAPAAPKRRRARPLARGRAAHVRSRRRRDGRAPRRASARPRGAGGQQLPLVRGSPRALRARQGVARRAAHSPVPGRHDDAPRGTWRSTGSSMSAGPRSSEPALSGRSAPATGGRRCRASLRRAGWRR